MPLRHRDFERIYTDFQTYYQNRAEADREYNQWLKDLDLDETREYGAARESFQWAKDMLQYLKEDDANKYYTVLVGFPITSMNGNVYHERDLIADTQSLKGKHPSLNHKDAFWFNEANPYGQVTVHDAKFAKDDRGFGAAEVILQVPKVTRCPICNGAPMTELIDNHKIVNVSLEGECKSGFGGECSGFTFRQNGPPFTLLTSDTLPGIPLARIKPLENIMVEALQASTKQTGEKKMAKKIEAKIIETNIQGSTYAKNEPQTPDDKTAFHNRTDPERTANSVQPQTVLGTPAAPDDHHFMKSGPEYAHAGPPTPHEEWKQKAIEKGFLKVGEPCSPEMQSCVDKLVADGKPESSAWAICKSKVGESEAPAHPTKNLTGGDYATYAGPSSDTSVPKPDNHIGPNNTTDPDMRHLKMPEGAPSSLPSSTRPSTTHGTPPVGDGTVMGKTPTEELIDEQVGRIKAETREAIAHDETEKLRESVKKVEAIWIDKFMKLSEEHRKQLAVNVNQEAIVKEQRETIRAEQLRSEDLRVEMRDMKNQFADATTTNNKYGRLVEDLKIENAELNKKYHGSLQTNLELSKKLTLANEEYLEIAKQKEKVEDDLKLARKEAKKILRIKV